MAQKSAPKSSAAKKSASPPASLPSEPSPVGETFIDLLTHFAPFAADIAGVFCLALALMSLLTLAAPPLTSGLLDWWGEVLVGWAGWGAIWLPVLVGLFGLWLFRRRFAPTGASFWVRFVALELGAFASLGLLAVLGGMDAGRAGLGYDGGRIGWALAELVRRLLAPVGLGHGLLIGALFLVIFLLGLLVGTGVSARLAARPSQVPAHSAPDALDSGDGLAGAGVVEAPMPGAEARSLAAPGGKRRPATLPPQFRKNFRIQDDEPAAAVPAGPRDERLPPLDLLVYEHYSRPDERTINQTAGLIEKTLADFGIPANVVGFRVGPTVTQFEVVPGYVEKDKDKDKAADKEKPAAENGEAAAAAARQKVRVAQISALSRDLALALSAQRLRIEAPVPGRPYVGIEVPNPRASIVRMRPVIESEAFQKLNSPLAIALGRDVSGQPAIADLARMPHVLIAGTTGSGKSVCIAALTTCLVMNNHPDDLRLVMIDPKMVELVRFNGLPHLYGKVETNVERIGGVLQWTVVEMDRRYKVLEAFHSRNIDSYNRKARRRKDTPPMPRIVVMIDELADLMMSSPEQTEHNLVRLAQMARAVGIHLVVATQRPGVEVVTGLIKANFPARISFAVASSVDSRVILDTVGAENLLGRGDMLFLPPDASGPQRLQGVMVSDAEVEKVINFWHAAASRTGEAGEPSPWDEMIAKKEILADRDGLVEQAIDIVRQERRANASMLQRRLRIGYPRAARLLDELEELGIIGPSTGGTRDREVLEETSGEDGET